MAMLWNFEEGLEGVEPLFTEDEAHKVQVRNEDTDQTQPRRGNPPILGFTWPLVNLSPVIPPL